MTAPRIVTYKSTDAPSGHEFITAYFTTIQTPKGKKHERLPIIFNASTAESAYSAAVQWWKDEEAKIENAKRVAEERAARLRRVVT